MRKQNVLCVFFLIILLTGALRAQDYEWQHFHSFGQGAITCLLVSGDYLYAGHSGDGLYRSTDELGEWEKLDIHVESFYPSVLKIFNDKYYLGTDRFGLYVSDDGVQFEPFGIGLHGTHIYDVTVDSSNIYTATEIGLFCISNQMPESDWEKISLGDGRRIRLFSVSGGDGALATAGSGKVYVNNGNTEWEHRSVDFTYDIRYTYFDANNTLYIGTGGAGIQSLAYGTMAWDTLDYDGPDGAVQYLIDDGTDHFLIQNDGPYVDFGIIGEAHAVQRPINMAIYQDHYYAGTNGYGIWKYVQLGNKPEETVQKLAVVDQVVDQLPTNDSGTERLKVFPNPATDNISIQYELLEGQSYDFLICSASGQCLHAWSIDPFHSGKTTESLDVDLDSGQYKYYLVRDQQIVDKGQLVVIR